MTLKRLTIPPGTNAEWPIGERNMHCGRIRGNIEPIVAMALVMGCLAPSAADAFDQPSLERQGNCEPRILRLAEIVNAGSPEPLELAVAAEEPLTIEQARVAVTGYDVNRPEPFPGLGEFGWPGNIGRLPNGELLLVHTAGYYHVSFAQPRLIEEKTRERWLARGWPLDFPAPTGGRSMITRSADRGQTWSQPEAVIDLPLDDGAYGLLRCPDGTLLCFMNVQASWYGFDQAPEQFRHDIDGLNTQQCVVRSRDNGQTWSAPIWLKSPGKFYERSHAQPILLPDGGILWPTYFAETRTGPLAGAIHRSDDNGQTWRHISTVRRPRNREAAGAGEDGAEHVDEPAIARLKDGRLLLVTRPDGATFYSKDDGGTWTAGGRLVGSGMFKAPRLFVLENGTVVCACTWQGSLHVFLGNSSGEEWSKPLALDPLSYGYPGGVQLEDGSLLISYCSSGAAPNRIYVVRFKANESRDGVELLPVGG